MKKKAEKLGRVAKGGVIGTVDAVSTGLNVSRSEARSALAKFLRKLRG